MNITIFGSGYVGLVTGTCFADVGNDVLCVDVDTDKVARLNRGEVPIHEPGLEKLIHRNAAAGRLQFTTDIAAGVAHGLFQFIAVGTPPDEDGSADLQYVLAVARSIGEHMEDFKLVVDKSTVPVGTADRVRETIGEALSARGASVDFDVVSNPEFLKEGAAIEDFMKPDRIIVGVERDDSVALLENLYSPFNRNHNRMIVMDVRSAELTKYAANAMLATKISFMNEMANIADHVGADIENVRIGMGSDPRIGYHFIYPGAGYGGSCFPKDVRALERTARQYAYDGRILAAVEQINDNQKKVLFDKISKHYGDNLKGKTFALWGLAFKPNTDDMREAPSRVLMEALWNAGAKVRAFDPEAMGETRRLYGERDDLTLCDTADEACAGADALVLMTEWRPFRSPNFDAIKASLSEPVIFDGRNVYDPSYLRRIGFTYYGIGRR
ncbi:MAG TPA: UDP-glucose/GDP-mannose dehydrogenase family protein [Gammaproteobacteria bacterium]|jgi:UDPglucose 6-dehydrogenase|nr:UDP-glucose/GDP-mannose dehydrogenase family protein [Gammaproteobacteria bacterium]